MLVATSINFYSFCFNYIIYYYMYSIVYYTIIQGDINDLSWYYVSTNCLPPPHPNFPLPLEVWIFQLRLDFNKISQYVSHELLKLIVISKCKLSCQITLEQFSWPICVINCYLETVGNVLKLILLSNPIQKAFGWKRMPL